MKLDWNIQSFGLKKRSQNSNPGGGLNFFLGGGEDWQLGAKEFSLFACIFHNNMQNIT